VNTLVVHHRLNTLVVLDYSEEHLMVEDLELVLQVQATIHLENAREHLAKFQDVRAPGFLEIEWA
jgi:hypothetical protein